MAHDWLNLLECPENIADHEYTLVICYASGFFVDNNVLWKRDPQGAHKRVLYHIQRIEAMIAAHNDTGHRGYYTSHALLAE